jgi:hypothetical protein
MAVSQERTKYGEKIGGGFIILRRGRTSKRIKTPWNETPFEHPSYEAAEREMKRLAERNEGKEFCVFYQVTSAKK